MKVLKLTAQSILTTLYTQTSVVNFLNTWWYKLFWDLEVMHQIFIIQIIQHSIQNTQFIPFPKEVCN
jgi:hypothetical protein